MKCKFLQRSSWDQTCPSNLFTNSKMIFPWQDGERQYYVCALKPTFFSRQKCPSWPTHPMYPFPLTQMRKWREIGIREPVSGRWGTRPPTPSLSELLTELKSEKMCLFRVECPAHYIMPLSSVRLVLRYWTPFTTQIARKLTGPPVSTMLTPDNE